MKQTGMILKRLLDMFLSLVALIIFLPVMAITALLVLCDLGWPILYCPARAGLHSKSFVMYKFRTMRNTLDEKGELLPDEERLTPVGILLRSCSLDELPQLVNVLRGDMSLVGPRPLPPRYLDRYTPEQTRRHRVRPGMTGWAQVNGRNILSWEDKFRLDVWYVDNWSLGLDIRILAMTVMQVLSRRGISAEGYATMPEFTGTGTCKKPQTKSR